MEYYALKKIGIKETFGDVKSIAKMRIKEAAKATEDTGTEVKPRNFHVGRYYGMITAFRPGEHATFGPYIRFLGNFRAEISDPETGEIVGYRAPILFMPRFLADELHAQFVSTGEPVKFGFDISCRPDPEMANDYEYLAEPLVEIQADLDDFAKAFKPLDKTLLLAAPKAVTEEAPKASKAKAKAETA